MLKGWKTVIFNALVVITPILAAPEMRTLVGEYWPHALAAFGVVNLVLRSITTSPVLRK